MITKYHDVFVAFPLSMGFKTDFELEHKKFNVERTNHICNKKSSTYLNAQTQGKG